MPRCAQRLSKHSLTPCRLFNQCALHVTPACSLGKWLGEVSAEMTGTWEHEVRQQRSLTQAWVWGTQGRRAATGVMMAWNGASQTDGESSWGRPHKWRHTPVNRQGACTRVCLCVHVRARAQALALWAVEQAGREQPAQGERRGLGSVVEKAESSAETCAWATLEPWRPADACGQPPGKRRWASALTRPQWALGGEGEALEISLRRNLEEDLGFCHL